MKTEKTLFLLPDNGKDNVPLNELHYYQWMKGKGLKDVRTVETLKAYLAEVGFNKEIHTLGADWQKILRYMGYAEEVFFQNEIRPTWKCSFCGRKDVVGKHTHGDFYCQSCLEKTW